MSFLRRLVIAFVVFSPLVVRDASPMKNAGSDPGGAFKTGDALHLYLSTDASPATARTEGGPNDFHLLMTVQQGKPVVFGFRQKKTGVTNSTAMTAGGDGYANLREIVGLDTASRMSAPIEVRVCLLNKLDQRECEKALGQGVRGGGGPATRATEDNAGPVPFLASLVERQRWSGYLANTP